MRYTNNPDQVKNKNGAYDTGEQSHYYQYTPEKLGDSGKISLDGRRQNGKVIGCEHVRKRVHALPAEYSK